MFKLIYDRYVAAGGALEFEAFQHPTTGLVSIAVVDGEPTITRWDEALVILDVALPTPEELSREMTASPTIEEERSSRIAVLDAACASEIVSGFMSDALGAEFWYPSDEVAQRNLMGSLIEALIPGLPDEWKTPFWCADGSGHWAYRLHSASEIIAAGRSGKAHVISCQSKLAALTEQVMAAESSEEIAAITW